MAGFRTFLIIILAAIAGYTMITISRHGLNLLPIFFGDMAAMTWPGQFNFDFMGFLILSALWTSWRENFAAKGLILGFFALTGGMLFLSAYLVYLSYKTNGRLDKIMMGDHRSV